MNGPAPKNFLNGGLQHQVDHEAFSKAPASIEPIEVGPLVDVPTEQPEERDEPDAPQSGNSVAVEHLTQIVRDTSATVRQRLKACSLLLSYRSDAETNAFARRFLEKVVARSDTPVDYKLDALEQLRRAMGDPQLKPSIVKLTPPAPPRDREAEEEERRIVSERRRKHLEEQSRLDQERLRQEWKQQGWTWPSA
jgi:hypothetical protein